MNAVPIETSSPSLQERKQQLVKTAIWDAATDLFAERGFDETTIDDIAERAGISRRSFFRYFSSKSELMAHAVSTFATYLTEAIDGCAPESSFPQVFRHAVFDVARLCASHTQTRKIMEIGAKHPSVREAQQSRSKELQAQVEAAYARRFGSSSSNEVLTAGVAAALTVSILGVIFQTWFEQGQQDISDTAEQVLSGLGYLIGDSSRMPGCLTSP